MSEWYTHEGHEKRPTYRCRCDGRTKERDVIGRHLWIRVQCIYKQVFKVMHLKGTAFWKLTHLFYCRFAVGAPLHCHFTWDLTELRYLMHKYVWFRLDIPPIFEKWPKHPNDFGRAAPPLSAPLSFRGFLLAFFRKNETRRRRSKWVLEGILEF